MTRRFADEFKIENAFLPMIVEREPVQLHKVTRIYVPQYPIWPLERVRETFRRKRTEWEASVACKELLSTLETTQIPTVQKIVAFACFNMSDCEVEERSAVQHALILTLRYFFAKHQHVALGGIRCFAQDPLYEDLDREVLKESGVSVLDNPRAFLEVDETSVVFCLSAETAVRQVVTDITRPALLIWNRVEEVKQ